MKKNFFATTATITYAGMPNDKTYSLVYNYHYGYQASACNYFFPKSQTFIDLAQKRITVMGVSADQITLQVEP